MLSNSPEALLLASQDRSGFNEYDEAAYGLSSTRPELPRVVRETFVTNLCRNGVCHIHCSLDDDKGVEALSRVSSALPVHARLRQQIKIKCTWPFAGSVGILKMLGLRIILPGLRCLCAVHLLIWDRRGRPALPSVRVESSLVLAMKPPAHALDGLPAHDTTGYRRDGLPLDATVASPSRCSKSWSWIRNETVRAVLLLLRPKKTALNETAKKKKAKETRNKKRAAASHVAATQPPSRSAECCYLVLLTFLGSHTIFGHGYSRGCHTARIRSYLLLDTRE